MANLIDFSNAFAKVTVDVYKKTLDKATEENISDPAVSETRERILKDLYSIAQTTQQLAKLVNSNRKKYEELFKETAKIEYEEALFTFEDNSRSLKESTQELLKLGYDWVNNMQLPNNQWASKIMLALVQVNPEQYSSILNLKTNTDQIVSDESWVATGKYFEGWANPDFNSASWECGNYVSENNNFYQNKLVPIWYSTVDSSAIVNDSIQVDTSRLSLADSARGTKFFTDSLSGDSLNKASQQIPQNSKIACKRVYFRKGFSIAGLPVSADIKLVVDDSYNLFFNGEYIASVTNEDSSWQTEHAHQLSDYLVEGENIIAIEAIDNDATAEGLVAVLTVKSLPGWFDKQYQIQLETSDNKIKQNLIMDKYIIIH
jgi:hypothetical protein